MKNTGCSERVVRNVAHPSIPTDSSSISIAICSSAVAVNSPSHHTRQYTSERIKFLLKQQPSIYNVIENEKTNSSLCWKIFNWMGGPWVGWAGPIFDSPWVGWAKIW
jgi:hypothetical protein